MVNHLDDLESDFLAIYRIEDIYSMPGARFCSFAKRVAAYDGVIAARIREASREKKDQERASTRTRKGKTERLVGTAAPMEKARSTVQGEDYLARRLREEKDGRRL